MTTPHTILNFTFGYSKKRYHKHLLFHRFAKNNQTKNEP